MRIAVIADVHANLEALQAVFERIRALNVDEIVSIGDMVGYNANPNECLDILLESNVSCVIGNHDAVAAGIEEPVLFNSLAREAVFWTREQLTEKSKEFLLKLPREKQIRDFLLFHGSIRDQDRYILSRDDVAWNFRLFAGPEQTAFIGFYGHTHIPAAWTEHQGVISATLQDEVALLSDRKYLINPGSVGQPRDGDPRAAFLIYDEQERLVVFYRVEYDISKCQDKILSAGLPMLLAERLAWGK